jgi:hypothetical protein
MKANYPHIDELLEFCLYFGCGFAEFVLGSGVSVTNYLPTNMVKMKQSSRDAT